MRHFIRLRNYSKTYIIYYCYNDDSNKIGDFSTYYSGIDNSWNKYRRYRGEYVYSKKPHYESSNGMKVWNYNGNAYSSYETYIMRLVVE